MQKPVKSFIRRITHFLAYGFGLGKMPVAPGTFGTLAALPIYLLLQHLPLAIYSLWVGILFVIGIGICQITANDLQHHDHPSIVWDEIVGYLLTMLLAPFNWVWMIIGFLLFRLFDIAKPWPIGYLDRHIQGGLGIMLDDIAAALYALTCLQILTKLLAI